MIQFVVADSTWKLYSISRMWLPSFNPSLMTSAIFCSPLLLLPALLVDYGGLPRLPLSGALGTEICTKEYKRTMSPLCKESNRNQISCLPTMFHSCFNPHRKSESEWRTLLLVGWVLVVPEFLWHLIATHCVFKPTWTVTVNSNDNFEHVMQWSATLDTLCSLAFSEDARSAASSLWASCKFQHLLTTKNVHCILFTIVWMTLVSTKSKQELYIYILPRKATGNHHKPTITSPTQSHSPPLYRGRVLL